MKPPRICTYLFVFLLFDETKSGPRLVWQHSMEHFNHSASENTQKINQTIDRSRVEDKKENAIKNQAIEIFGTICFNDK